MSEKSRLLRSSRRLYSHLTSPSSHPMACHAMPSHPTHPIPSHAIPSRHITCHRIPSHPIPSHLIPSFSMPSHAIPCRPIPPHAFLSHPIPSHPIPSHPTSSHLVPANRRPHVDIADHGQAVPVQTFGEVRQGDLDRGVEKPANNENSMIRKHASSHSPLPPKSERNETKP